MNVRERSTIRAIRGPVTLITVGLLFALNNFTGYGFDQTWPVLLIVFGVMSLLARGAEPPRLPPPPPPPYMPPGPGYPPPAGGYRQTTYSQPNDPNNPGGHQ